MEFVFRLQFRNDGVSAMRDYQHAIQLNPSYALAYYNAANVYFFSRQFMQASGFCELTLPSYSSSTF